MLKYLAVQSLRFGEPLYVWLLIAPAALLTVDLAGRRGAPMPENIKPRVWSGARDLRIAGELAFWFFGICALALTICARQASGDHVDHSRPGADIVLLMDGSASMRVTDMGTDRWQRAMTWVRTLTQTLAWDGDRVALATFADIAVPQIRLTRDPNTILFFLDHLDKQPTFKLEDDTTWDTNVEDAIYWGMKVVDTDREMYGPSKNAKTFVIVSDGQVWSGNVQRALALAVQHGIMVDVIGVSTSTGGMIRCRAGDTPGAPRIPADPVVPRPPLADDDGAEGDRRVFRAGVRVRRADCRAHHPERRQAIRQRAGG